MRDVRLGLIGAGRMGEAMVRGILAAHRLAREEILAADPDPDRRRMFLKGLGVSAVAENETVVEQAATILVAVKPQVFDRAITPVGSLFGPAKLLISICAGVSTHHIETLVASGTRVVRAMPNTPIGVGRGIVAISGGSRASEADLAEAERLLGAAAETLRVPEDLMDAVTAVSGSGPAYFFYLMELLARAGVKVGLSEEEARHLARVTFEGAARLLVESGAEPEDLRRQVTSPGGTTESAIRTLDALGFAKMVEEAVRAARDRGHELGR